MSEKLVYVASTTGKFQHTEYQNHHFSKLKIGDKPDFVRPDHIYVPNHNQICIKGSYMFIHPTYIPTLVTHNLRSE